MDIRDSFSRLKNKLKRPLTGEKSKPGKTQADAGGERVDPAGLLARPEPHIVVSGSYVQEENGANRDGWQARSADRLPQPESVIAHGSENNQRVGEAHIDGGEANQVYSHLHPNAEVVVESGSKPGRDGNDADGAKTERVGHSPSSPSIPHGGRPDSM